MTFKILLCVFILKYLVTAIACYVISESHYGFIVVIVAYCNLPIHFSHVQKSVVGMLLALALLFYLCFMEFSSITDCCSELPVHVHCVPRLPQHLAVCFSMLLVL